MEKELIKFYADAPDGTRNKLLCYKVKDLSHSLDLLRRFEAKGWKILRAYHHLETGKEISISKEMLAIEVPLETVQSIIPRRISIKS